MVAVLDHVLRSVRENDRRAACTRRAAIHRSGEQISVVDVVLVVVVIVVTVVVVVVVVVVVAAAAAAAATPTTTIASAAAAATVAVVDAIASFVALSLPPRKLRFATLVDEHVHAMRRGVLAGRPEQCQRHKWGGNFHGT
jgi:cell division protein FtsL